VSDGTWLETGCEPVPWGERAPLSAKGGGERVMGAFSSSGLLCRIFYIYVPYVHITNLIGFLDWLVFWFRMEVELPTLTR